MADNTTINPQSGGDVIATDDVGGVKYPRTKIQTGADGVAGGDVTKTNPFPTARGAGLAATGTQSNVGDATSATTILASNSARIGATIWNDSTAVLYLLLGTGTVSATLCTVKLIADAYFEVPFGYTGAVTGIWASDAGGSARVTEFT